MSTPIQVTERYTDQNTDPALTATLNNVTLQSGTSPAKWVEEGTDYRSRREMTASSRMNSNSKLIMELRFKTARFDEANNVSLTPLLGSVKIEVPSDAAANDILNHLTLIRDSLTAYPGGTASTIDRIHGKVLVNRVPYAA